MLPARLDPTAVPLGVHIVSVIVYAVLGAFQFSAGLRRRRPGWHRAAGRLLVVVGMVVALSALCLDSCSTPAPKAATCSTCSGCWPGQAWPPAWFSATRRSVRRDLAAHLAWMTRAYALALGAGTQVFTEGFGQAIFGTGDRSVALQHAAGWVINLAVAELVIRRQMPRLSANTIVTAR